MRRHSGSIAVQSAACEALRTYFGSRRWTTKAIAAVEWCNRAPSDGHRYVHYTYFEGECGTIIKCSHEASGMRVLKVILVNTDHLMSSLTTNLLHK
jgi:hypothetical protein